MTRFWKQVAAGVLAASAAGVGGWAQFFPASFYRRFPLSSHPWIAPTGAYNEHLIRDVGSGYLALFVLTAWALFGLRREMLVAGSAWTVFSVPHLVFHLAHLDEFGTADKVANIVALAGTVVLSAALLLPERSPVHQARVEPEPASR